MDAPTTRYLRLTAAAAALACALAAPVQAQEAAPDQQFAALESRLRIGDALRITAITGEVVKGHLAAVEPHQVTVLVGGERRSIEAWRVERVQRTRVGVVLGAIIGTAAGMAAGAALASLAGNEGGSTTAAFMMPVAIGLGAGVGLDGLINLPRTVYRRNPGTRLGVAPILGEGAIGGSIRLEF